MSFVTLLSFGISFSQNVKCTTLFNQPCLTRAAVINLNCAELTYYPFMVKLDRCDGSRNTLALAMIIDLFDRLCVPNKDANVKIFNTFLR